MLFRAPCSAPDTFLLIFSRDCYHRRRGVWGGTSYHVVPESRSHLHVASLAEMKAVCSEEAQIWLAVL